MRFTRNTRTILRAAVASCAAITITVAATIVVGSGEAAAVPTGSPGSTGADFYSAPADLDVADGTVLRSEPMPLLLGIPGAPGSWPGDGTRVLYRSTDGQGRATAISGTFIAPQTAWKGTGERPVVVIGPGTQGQGDQCAPSKMFSTGGQIDPTRMSFMVNYEAVGAYLMASQGVAVFVTDYKGLGTPGVHTYVNTLDEGHAMLDGARAALNLLGGETGRPVGFWGYSQGGGAAAAAAEQWAEYAPELSAVGAWIGGPPADLTKVLRTIDGNLIGGAIGYAVNGLVAEFPEMRRLMDEVLSDHGRATMARLENECITDSVLTMGLRSTRTLTKDGRPFSEILEDYPEAKKALEEQLIGNTPPRMPVFVTTGVADDVIPNGQAREMARRWCAGGTRVAYTDNLTPMVLPNSAANHLAPMLGDLPGSNDYIMGRFAGTAAPSNCGAF